MNDPHYYNEHDEKAAAWLRELIAEKLIPDGTVDTRSIVEVQPADLAGFVQCHFFAGVAGWPLALQLAGVDPARPLWTGSCPCQPFSTAGKQLGTDDERHLWPAFYRLICECRPPLIFGEQVASAAVIGSAAKPAQRGAGTAIQQVWLDGICADLEAAHYACGAGDLPAAGVGAPHIRQRLFWVADANGCAGQSSFTQSSQRTIPEANGGDNGWLADTECGGSETGLPESQQRQEGNTEVADDSGNRVHHGLEHAPCDGRDQRRAESGGRSVVSGCSDGGMGDSNCPGSQPRQPTTKTARHWDSAEPAGHWSQFDLIPCADGKVRRITRVTESLFQSVFDGVPGLLGDGWDQSISRLEKEVTNHAEKTSTSTGKALRAMWDSVAQTSLWREPNTGGHEKIPEPEILLLTLCELARNMGQEFFGVSHSFEEVCEASVRIMWINQEAARSPQESQLDGQQPGESPNALRLMSCKSAQAKVEVYSLLCGLAEAQDVPASFPEMEEVWRSILDQKAIRERVQTCKGAINAAQGFPLAKGIKGRTMLLRGAGNAIVPQVASEFIQTFLAL